jgi:hypothetical protein
MSLDSIQSQSKSAAISTNKMLMLGQQNLDQLLQSMSPVVHSEVFVFCSFADGSVPHGMDAICTFREDKGLTAILPKSQASAFNIDFQFESTLITLSVHSSLFAVGFLARVCSTLAALDIPCNAVSGFYHDHLFVPSHRTDEAVAALKELSGMSA